MPATSMDRLGRYEILEELGRGAMGTVYRARDPKIDRIVAIKTIRTVGADAAEMGEYRKRFFREAQAAGKISHPGIVTIYDVGEEESTETPYIVMEYINGQTLAELLSGSGTQRPSLETSLHLVKQLAEALDYAHAHNIVHRDIKPTNIIVTRQGRAKITDFGVAKLTLAEMTVPGAFIGTPSYASPEQLKGDTVDGRSDLFSLGVILYWTLTGEKPFTGDGTAVFAKILHQEPAPVTQCNASLRPDFDTVVSRALAKNPEDRYQRGNELADDLDALLRGRAPRAPNDDGDGQATARKTSSQDSAPPPLLEQTALLDSAASLLPQPAAPATAVRQKAAGPLARAIRHATTRRAAIAGSAGLGLVGIVLVVLWFVRPAHKPAPAPSIASLIPLYKPTPISKPTPMSSLRIDCYHGFHIAEISVWVDGDPAYAGKLIGEPDRGFQLFKKRIISHMTKTLRLPAGKHTIQVQVQAPGEDFSQTKKITTDFPEDGVKTLSIGFGRRNKELFLSWAK